MNGMRLVDNVRRAPRQLLATVAAVFLFAFIAGEGHAGIVFSGTSAEVGAVADYPQGVALADFDNDGLLDIVAVLHSGSDYEVIAWRNNGTPFTSGTWTRCNVGALSDWGNSVAVADLNNDGRVDIVVGANAGEALDVIAYENDGTPFDGLWPRHDIGSSGGSRTTTVAVGDLDNDGWTDVVSLGGGGGGSIGSIRAWHNDGAPFAGLWTGTTVFSAPDMGVNLAVADLDKDGYLDLVANHNVTSVSAFRNDGTPFAGAWTGTLVGTGCSTFTTSIVAADFDNDGYPDLLTTCGYLPAYEQRIWRNNGTPFGGPWDVSYLGSVPVASAVAGDFNLDGRVDIAMSTYLGDVLVWENNGAPFSGHWTSYNVGSTGAVALTIAAGDLDNDGDPDIVTGGVPRVVSAWQNLAAAKVSVVPPSSVTSCAVARSVEFHIDHEQTVLGDVRGYEVVFSIDTTVVRIPSPSVDITEGTFMSSRGTSQFYVTPEGGGVYTVSCAILGGDAGGRGHASLFNVRLTPVAEGTSAIAIASVRLRDLDNHPLPVGQTGGSIHVDCTPPTMEPLTEPGGGWYSHAPAFANFGFDDNFNLDLAECRLDAGPWTTIFSGIDAAAWDSDGWTLAGFAGLSEGSHTIYFRVKDDAGNWNGEGGSEPALYRWQFYKDTTPPAAPTGFAAAPGNNKTHLTWRNPTGDPTFAGVEIRFNRWNGYPEYGPPEPPYPANHTLGTFVTLTAAEACDDNPRTPRDIYYYTAFSKDLAGNYSSYTVGAAGRATSYWLGDLDADGRVYTNDLVIFSAAFGRQAGQPGWNDICDFGPTNDYSRFGIPIPDKKVTFEDLMIFSMNWDKVTPLGLVDFVTAPPLENLEDLVHLDVTAVDDNTISIVLKNRAATLKGVHVIADVAGADLLGIKRGAALGGDSELFFGALPVE
ncbi:MAG: VCBS repeat-containing protein, partial [Candidatus Krumholzibacteriaceae bacterium]